MEIDVAATSHTGARFYSHSLEGFSVSNTYMYSCSPSNSRTRDSHNVLTQEPSPTQPWDVFKTATLEDYNLCNICIQTLKFGILHYYG